MTLHSKPAVSPILEEARYQFDETVCRLAVIPNSISHDYVGNFVVGSLLVDCKDTADVWSAMSKMGETDNADELLAISRRLKESKRTGCAHSIYAIIIGQFLHKDFASYISAPNLYKILNSIYSTQEKICIDYPFRNLKAENLFELQCSLPKIARNLNEKDVSIVDYQEVVNEISKHPNWVQVLLERTVSLRCGPLRDITTRVNIENLNWFMNKLKIVNTIKLIHELFTSNSIVGKCSAIYGLLELHDLVWKSGDYDSINSMIPNLYSILTWMFEKCQLAGQKIADKFYWIKAKFTSDEDEENQTDKKKKKKKEDKEEKVVNPQCAKVFKNLIKEVDFDVWYRRFVDREAYAQTASHDNNCLMEAVCKAENARRSAHELRDDVYTWIVEHREDFFDISVANGYDREEIESKFDNIVSDLNSGEQLDMSIVPAISRVINRKIISLARTQAGIICHTELDFNPGGDTLYINCDLVAHHWTHSSKPEEEVITCNYFGLPLDDFVAEMDTIQPDPISQPEEEKPKEDDDDDDSEGIKLEEDVKKVHTESVSDKDTEEFIVNLESTEMGKGFLAWFKNMVGDVYQFFKKNPIIGGVIAFAFSLLSGIGITIGKFSNKFDKRCFFEKVSGCAKDFYYLSRGQDAIGKVFTDFGQIFRAMIGLDDSPEVTAFKKNLVDIVDKAEDLNNLATNNPDVITNDPKKVIEFKKEMESIRKQFRDLVKMDPTVNLAVLTPLWNRLNSVYHQLLANYNKICTDHNMRQRPYCLWLHGRSNIGKSELIEKIIMDFNEKNNTCWDRFVVSKGPEYLNGFKQERIIVVDDFDTFASVEGCLDALLVMNMVTTAAYNPNIANLEDKNIQAKPALLIIASNFATARLNCGINCFEAFERRRDKLIHVRWKEHEGCAINDESCTHKQALKDYVEKENKKSFDHLSFEDENTLVISHKKNLSSPEKNWKPVKKGAKCADPPKFGYDGVEISYQEIVDHMVDRVTYYRKSYEVSKQAYDEQKRRFVEKNSKNPEAALNNGLATVTNWANAPNIILSGPPGTGKTQAFLNMMEKIRKTEGKTFTYIDKQEQFDAGASINWKYTTDFVIFDDLSTYKHSKNLPAFFKAWKERHDARIEVTPWVIGINRTIAIEMFDTIEDFEVFSRRSRTFEFSFRPKNGSIREYLAGVFFTYTAKDVKITDERPHNHYVRIVDVLDDRDILHSSLVDLLLSYQSEVAGTVFQAQLDTIYKLDVDAKVTVNCTVDKFISLVNSKDTSVEVMRMLLQSTFISNSSKMSKSTFGKRLWATFTNLSHAHGSKFASMDDFVLAGANGGFFNAFNDGCYVMGFIDRAYCLFPCGERVISGIYEPADPKRDMSKLKNATVKEVTKLDFLSVTHNKLPPWFIVSMLIGEQVLKILAAGSSIAYNIKAVNQANKILKTYSHLDDSVDKSVDQGLKKMTEKIDSTLVTEENRVIQTEYEPSEDSDDDDDDPTSQSDKDTNKKKMRFARVRSRQPKGKNKTVKAQCSDITLEIPLTNPTIKSFNADIKEGLQEALELIVPQEHEAMSQLANDSSLHDIVRVISKNMVSIQDLKGNHIVYGLMLSNKKGTTVNHIFLKQDASHYQIVDILGTKSKFKVIFQEPINDRADFEVETGRQFPSILNHLAEPSNALVNGKIGCLAHVDMRILKNMPVLVMRFYRLRTHGNITLKNMYEVDAYSYHGSISGFSSEIGPQTIGGDCGSVMFLCDQSQGRKVIGMHVASDTVEGFFRKIASSHYAVHAQSAEPFGNGPIGEYIPVDYKDKDGTRVVAKCVEPPFMPEKSKLYRSPFAYGECKYEPAVLSPKDTRRQDIDNMLYREGKKWTFNCSVDLTNKSSRITARMIDIGDYLGQKLNLFGIQTMILNKTTALNSVRGFTHSQPIPVGTSAGYPFNALVRNGKRELIHVHDDGFRTFSKHESVKPLHNSIDAIMRDARLGKQSDVAFTVFGKDELLKKGKNTRTIAAAPLPLVVPLRMYFHTIYAALSEIHNIIPIKIGISATSMDWHGLTVYFKNVSDEGFAIDQKGFDFKIPKEIAVAVVDCLIEIARITNADLTEEDENIMRALHLNVSKFRVILQGRVYQSTIGIPSGHPGTAPENSLISFFLCFDAFCELAPEYVPHTVEAFVDYVALAIYGDDVTCTVAECAQNWYNQITVTDYLVKSYGLEITNADKTLEVKAISPLTDLEFISRNFKCRDGYWIGPLKMERLVKPLHFCNGRKSHHWFLEQNKYTDDMEIACCAARSALEEMFFHGRTQFENLRKHILKKTNGLSMVEVNFPTWNTLLDNYFGMPSVDTELQVMTFSVPHQVIKEIAPLKEWFKYNNRRCLLFGEKYEWDERSRNAKVAKMPITVFQILKKLNLFLGTDFNQILVNQYAPGDEIPWHKDNEKCVDLEQGVACLTVIGDGIVHWKDAQGITQQRITMLPDTLYYMKGKYLTDYQHKRDSHCKWTYSMTFRHLVRS